MTIKIDPSHEDSYVSAGIALCELEKYDEAIEYYKQALEINPNHANA